MESKEKIGDSGEVLSTREGCVFLIDDNPIFTTILEGGLRKVLPNVTIKHFHSGESALVEMDQNPFLVFLDYDLAGVQTDVMNGIKVLKAIKNFNPSTEVIMLSTVEDPRIVAATMKHGAFDYIPKDEKALFDVRHKLSGILRKLRISDEVKEERKINWFLIWGAIIILLCALLGFIFTEYS